ncbi:MAG: hypothetical protein AB7W16_17350 [Candidatus Obscuribacterales bacterium]
MRQLTFAIAAIAVLFVFAGPASAQGYRHNNTSIVVGPGGFGISISKGSHGRHGGRDVNIDVFSGPFGTGVGVGVHRNGGWHQGPIHRHPQRWNQQQRWNQPSYQIYQPISVQVVEVIQSYEPEVVYDQWGRPVYTGRQVLVTTQVTRTVQASWDYSNNGYYYHNSRGVRCRYNGRW